MIDEFAKQYLHRDLRDVRETMIWKLDGLAEYDIRRPLTPTGTNLLGLIKHLTITEAWYFGEAFGRPFPERLPWRDDETDERAEDAKLAALFDYKLQLADMWATEEESRAEIVDRYRRIWVHADATITALDIDAPGHVPWWPRPNVMLFNIMVHVLTETNRHAGHADILREQLDGAVGTESGSTALYEGDTTFWESHRTNIERAAMSSGPAGRLPGMGTESVHVATTVEASPEAVFAVLADPSAHAAIDGTGWVRESLDGDRITAAGQVFRMAMYHPNHPDKDYEIANRVEVFDEPRAIAWQPGSESAETGELSFGGWVWRYDLEATEPSRTTVTLTYDWSAVPPDIRERIPFPPFELSHLDNSLQHLSDLARSATT